MEKVYIKYLKPYDKTHGINPYSGLNQLQSFKLEKKCLKLLGKNYICTCGHGLVNGHFPKLLDKDSQSFRLTMTWVGETIRELKQKKRSLMVPNLDKQIKCIINNLNRAGVYHLDMHRSGKNLCIYKNTLSVIDFDIAVYKSTSLNKSVLKPNSNLLTEKLERYKIPTYGEHFSNLIKEILIPGTHPL